MFGKCLVIVLHINGFKLCHMSAQTSRLYEFTKVIKFIVCINKLLCLYANNSLLMLTYLHTFDLQSLINI